MFSPQYSPPDDGSSTGPSASTKGKRKAQMEPPAGGTVAKRSRVHFSCVECNRSATEETPALIASLVESPTSAENSLTALRILSRNHDTDVRVRLDKVEILLESLVSKIDAVLPSLSGSQPQQNTNSSAAIALKSRSSQARGFQIVDSEENEMPREGEGGDEHDGTMRDGRFYGPSASTAMSSGARMSKLLRDLPPDAIGASASALPERISLSSFSHHQAIVLPRVHSNTALVDQTEPLPAPLLSALNTLDESGFGLDNIFSLLERLPSRDLRSSLIKLYWAEIDWTRYHVYQPDFQARYESFFAFDSDPGEDKPYPFRTLDAGGLKWLPLLFIMMAISTLTAPVSLFGNESARKAWTRSLYGASRRATNIAQALQKDTLDVLAARLLTSRYLLLVRRGAEDYTPLPTAIQLGLHRDGSHLGLTDPREIELRRRFWSYSFVADRSASLLVGRPTGLSPSSYDTLPPANLDDVDLLGDFNLAGRPLSQPTVMTYVIFRHSLATIMGRISDRIFSLKPPQYSSVFELDEELIAWKETLPPYFKLENADTSLDAEYHFLVFHRSMLASEFYYTRITLHRPYMLKKRDSEVYSFSRKAAVESAQADLIGRREFLLGRPKTLGQPSTGSYWVLNSFIIIGLSILLEPTSTQSNELKSLLNVLTGRAPDEEGRVSEATVRELAVAELFNGRDQTALDTAPPSPSFPRPSLRPSSDLYPHQHQTEGSLDGNAGSGTGSVVQDDFLGPSAQSSSISSQLKPPAAITLVQPGHSFWVEKDPVNRIPVQYHRHRGEPNAQGSGSGSRQETHDAWSEAPRGLQDHPVQGPGFAAPSSSSNHHPQHLSQYQNHREDLPGSSLLTAGGFSYQQQQQYLMFSSFGMPGVALPEGVDVGMAGTAEDQFLSPWSREAAGMGFAGPSESGEGESDVLGEPAELAFLNQLISAINSGEELQE